MTATGVPDHGVPEAPAERWQETPPERPGPGAAVATTGDPSEVETSHRLRRALRILLAARRRDEGGADRADDN